MLFVNYDINATLERLVSNINNNEKVVAEENYDLSNGKPRMHVKVKGERLKIKCEMTERATKDNGFLEGTYFLGSAKEKDGRSYVKGVILTAPIYHFIFLLLLGVVIYQSVIMVAIPITAIFLVLFDIMMFKGEFAKQSIIKRYIFRAFKITYRECEREEKR
jgi:hypothetical protein